MRAWFKRPSPSRLETKRFADLRAMTLEQRYAAITGPSSDEWIAAAARYGLVEAQLLHGQALLARDPALAIRWFRAAADAGYAPAINMVGRCFEMSWGVEQDFGEAARHYERSAHHGLAWAQYNLANLLLYGLGVPRDRTAALAWYRCAAGQGHAKAMNMIGRFHEEGWECPRSARLALKWYWRAAMGGDYRGQYNLGTVLAQQGRHTESCTWFEQALAVGDPDFVAEAAIALAGSAEPSFQELGKLASALPKSNNRRAHCPAKIPFVDSSTSNAARHIA